MVTELRFLFLSESQTLFFSFLQLRICQVIGCDGAQVKAESLFYWVSSTSFLRNFKLFFFIKSLLFLQIDLHINLGAVCVSPARHWTNSDTGSAWIMADTDHTPSKQKQSLSFQLWDGTISCVRSLGPGGRQHHYVHRFDYAAAGRVTLSALESNVCWLCIMSKSKAERLLFKSYVTH